MKFTNSLFIMSIRQAFLQIVPFYILSSLGLLFTLIESKTIEKYPIIEILVYLSDKFSYLFPFLLIISISCTFGKNYNINFLHTTILTLFVYLKLSTYFNYDGSIVFDKGMTIMALFLPILCHYLFIWITSLNFLKIVRDENIHKDLRNTLNAIFPVIILYLSLTSLIPFINHFLYEFFIYLSTLTNINFSLEVKSFLQIIFVQITWWLTGIHGTHIYNIFVNTSYIQSQIFPNITCEIFIYNLVMLGGAGATLSLILAILLFSKNKNNKKIAWISLSFSIFNINEIILFALPIILNIRFLIPFLVVPIVNFISSYIFLYFVDVSSTIQSINWSTPIFLSGYLIGNKMDFSFIFLQFFNLIIGLLIYKPFLMKYDYESSSAKLIQLEKKYGISHNENLKNNYENESNIKFYNSQLERIKKQDRVDKLVDNLISGELILYYQPQIDITTNKCIGFESLLRFKNKNRKINTPYFIPLLEENGYSYIIDLWVINQLEKDYQSFLYFKDLPKISINLSPQTLSDDKIIQILISKLKGFNIDIEILERTFALDNQKFANNLKKLRNNGFKICVDDFGTAYSSLQYLHTLPVNIIKFDRSLLNNTITSKGKILYTTISKMCLSLGYEIIAEGVETLDDVEFLKNCGIKKVQGFYFHRALPLEEAVKLL